MCGEVGRIKGWWQCSNGGQQGEWRKWGAVVIIYFSDADSFAALVRGLGEERDSRVANIGCLLRTVSV